MFDPKDAKLVPSEAWLRRVAVEEERFPSISVGGLVSRLGMYPNQVADVPIVFGELIKLVRRKEGLTVEQLALLAKVAADDLKFIEQGLPASAELVHRLADALRLPADKMAQLAGVSELKDPELVEAAKRFESKLHSPVVLSPQEESALNEIMQSIGD